MSDVIVDINHELYAFGTVVICIMLVCAVFDLLHTFYGVFRLKTGLRAVVDIIFWIVAGSFIWICLLAADNGELRAYHLTGGFLGGIVYFLALSRPVRALFKKIFEFFKLIFKILLTPARFFYKMLYRRKNKSV